MSLIKKTSVPLFIIIFTFLLLEFSSLVILNFFSRQFETVEDSFVFASQNDNGTFTPAADSVYPMQENFNYRWKREEFDVSVRTNSLGLREDFDVNYEDIDVLFFGDSFTFGHGVNVEERYTNIFARLNENYEPERVVNFSYKNGFQPEHYEFVFRNTASLKPMVVVVGLYLGNDFEADVFETEYNYKSNQLALPYRLIQRKGQIKLSTNVLVSPIKELSEYTSFGKLLVKTMGKTSFRTYLFDRPEIMPNSLNSINLELGRTKISESRTAKSIIRLAKEVSIRNGKLYVLVIPQNFYFGDRNPYITPSLKSQLTGIRQGPNLLTNFLQFCKTSDITCLDPSSVLTQDDYFPIDSHWTATGHKKIGMFLRDAIK